jgi:tetratricopeptide (TPR) repeat protein
VLVRAALKEKKMKRNLLLWLGLLAFALVPVLAQKPMGKIHGHVTDPVGTARMTGTVSLSTDGGHNSKYSFPLSSTGDYAGEAVQGNYTIVFRAPETPLDKIDDSIDNVKVVAGQDVLQDIDMSRKEFIEKLTKDQQKQLEEIKKRNAGALKANAIVNKINADIRVANQDIKDIDEAHATAVKELGATASKADLEAKENAIKTAKYTEIETLMLKDTETRPDASGLWIQLGQAQLGLARMQSDKSDKTKFDGAETSFKKALDIETKAKKPSSVNQGAAYSGLGEVYARTGKVPDANTAFDAAVKINPASAGSYLKNEAVIFFQEHNSEAQAAAADEAIKADPAAPLAYYLKGNGLIAATTVDKTTNKLVAPAGCLEAYQKYLELEPNGAYAGEVKGILVGFQATLPTIAPTKSGKSGKKK